MPPNKKLERIAKKFLLYFFGGLTLMVILIVVFSDDSVATENASEDKVKPVKQEIIEYTHAIVQTLAIRLLKTAALMLHLL